MVINSISSNKKKLRTGIWITDRPRFIQPFPYDGKIMDFNLLLLTIISIISWIFKKKKHWTLNCGWKCSFPKNCMHDWTSERSKIKKNYGALLLQWLNDRPKHRCMTSFRSSFNLNYYEFFSFLLVDRFLKYIFFFYVHPEFTEFQ